ncbi:MAG TPA: tetratricopeptide repeat protein [Thermoanaerobaculia bacterium]|nr:tetratricopeptide repeat protein [Thermoanaerobaculia bacterium]
MHRLYAIALSTVFAIAAGDLRASGRSAESVAAWREDIELLHRELPRVHKNAFHSMSREDLDAMVKHLSAVVPDSEDHEIVAGIARIVARVGDGHTHLNPSRLSGFRMLPLRFYLFSDGLFITSAAEGQAALVGAKVLRIGNLRVGEAIERLMEVTPRDNEMSARSMVAVHLGIPELLHALGVTDSRYRVTLEVEKGGGVRRETIEPVGFGDLRSLTMVGALPEGRAPLYLRARPDWPMQPLAKNFWYEVLPQEKAVYVKFDAVQWQDDLSPGRFFDEVFRLLDASPGYKLVIDVRNNGGGNNTLALPIVHGIIKRDEINQRGRLFTIIGRETFSAAQNFVNLMEKHTNTMFAGEPSGARPNHYGDPAPIRLPNSGIEIRASTLWWQDVHPADDRAWTAPHLAVEISSADYFAGRDPVLETVLAYDESSTLRAKMLSGLRAAGIAGAIEAYGTYKNDPVNRHQALRGELSSLGSALLAEEKIDEAIAVFALNTRENPEAANFWHSLGDAYARKGDRKAALAAYEKAVELAPYVGLFRRKLEEARKE